MAHPSERNFMEAFLEGAEAALDLLSDNEAVKAVPVVGTALKLLKGRDDLRDRALAAKLERFVMEPALQSEKARRLLSSDLAADANEAERIGETLFLVLERVTDLQKPSILARVFFAYLDGAISSAELRRLAHAVDGAFTDDLMSLEEWQEAAHIAYGASWKRPLVGAGLAQVVTGKTYDDGGAVYYELSELGRTLHRALWHARTA